MKTSPRASRSFRLWILLAGFAVLSIFGWLRMATSISGWYWLENVAKVDPGPRYLAISGAVWGAAGLVAFAWVFLKRAGYPQAGLAAAGFFAVSYWLDRLFISQTGRLDSNLPFAIGFTVFCLIAAAFVLWRESGADRRFLFGSSKEREDGKV